MNKLFVISTFLLASPAFAASGKITQLHPNQHRVFATLTAEVPEGTTVSVSFAKGRNCSLEVKKINGRSASLDTTNCPYERQLYVGQQIAELSRPAAKAAAEAAPAVPEKYENAQPNPYNGRAATQISDIQYVPAAGHFSGVISADASQANNGLSINGQKYDDVTQKLNNYEIALGYGISKYLAVAVSGSTATRNDSVSYGPGSAFNGSTATSSSNGLTDPNVKIEFRALDQDRAPVTLDFGLTYSPNSGTANQGTPGSSGNLYRGGDKKSVSAEVGQIHGPFQYSIGFIYNIVGAEVQTQAGSADLHIDAKNSMALTAETQFEITRAIFVRGAVAETNFGTTSQNTGGPTTYSQNSFNQTTLGLSGIFVVLPQKVALTLGYINNMSTTIGGDLQGSSTSVTTSSYQLSGGVIAEF